MSLNTPVKDPVLANKAKKIVAVAATKRLPTPSLKVMPDQPYITVFGASTLDDLMRAPDTMIGDDSVPALFVSPTQDNGEFPLLKKIHDRFKQEEPTPKPVRVDTPKTYDEYRTSRLKPTLDELDAKLAELEQLQANHADYDTARFAALQAEIAHLQDKADQKIPLSLPPYMDGKVDCWKDGDLICCSIKMPAPNGSPRVATITSPVEKHLTDVVGYTQEAGEDPLTVLGIIPKIACMLGGGRLIPQLASAAPSLMSQPEVNDPTKPFFVKVGTPDTTALVSMMALEQAAQQGNEQAKVEFDKLVEKSKDSKPLTVLIGESVNRLATAQYMKAQNTQKAQKQGIGANVASNKALANRVQARLPASQGDTVAGPAKVVIIPHNLAAYTLTDVTNVSITGGQRQILSYAKDTVTWTNPNQATITQKSGKKTVLPTLDMIYVSGGNRSF